MLMTVCCWAHLMESGLEQTMDLMTETSSACLLALWMEMQMVPLMDVGWVQMMELSLEQLMGMRMVRSSIFLSVERTGMLKVMLLD